MSTSRCPVGSALKTSKIWGGAHKLTKNSVLYVLRYPLEQRSKNTKAQTGKKRTDSEDVTGTSIRKISKKYSFPVEQRYSLRNED